MSEVSDRLHELRARAGDASEYDRIERAALALLALAGVPDTQGSVLRYEGTASWSKWAVWAAESMAWTACRLRAGEWREALRGYGQIKEYRGRNGGFLPIHISDYVGVIQNMLENRIDPR